MSGAARAQSEAGVSVDLGIGIAAPGQQASVPMMLSAPDSVRVGRVVLEAAFSRKLVSFRLAAKGPAAASFELVISTELLEKVEEDVLRVELSSSGPMPRGELVELKFDVSKEALPNDEVGLKTAARKVQTPEGEPLQATGSDGLITVAVLGDVIPACFFYMH